jgi:ADP-ribose pyrophosphatase
MEYRFEVLKQQVVYQGFFRMERCLVRHQLFAGGWTGPFNRECLERGHAVAVLPYDPVRDELVMLEQFRIGALAIAGGPWLLEIVAGIIGAEESKPAVAHREAAEEAGCELLELLPICNFLPSPGGSSETITLYCGRVDASGLGGIHGLPEEHEDIRVRVLPRPQALALLHEDRTLSASTIIALQWLALNWQSLQARWGVPALPTG